MRYQLSYTIDSTVKFNIVNTNRHIRILDLKIHKYTEIWRKFVAITSISRIQQRRGVKADLPDSLAEGEFGWCLDTRELFIGNSPGYNDNTQVLTEFSDNSELVTTRFRTYAQEIEAAITRPILNKNNDVTSVKDFGAIGDGVTDDAPAINAAIRELLSDSTGASVINPIIDAKRMLIKLPAGVYLINSQIFLYPYVTLVGDGIGKTIIKLGNPSATCMMETADSKGQTGSNIGLNGAQIPVRIEIRDMTITTNGVHKDIVYLTRYNNVRFERVELVGGWSTTEGLVNPHSAFTLKSIGNAVPTYDFQVVGCIIRNVTYGVYADDPVTYTTINRTRIYNVWRGLNIGEIPAFNGPAWTSVSQCRFYSIDDAAIIVFNIRPGVVSTNNTYLNCCLVSGAAPMYWGVSTNFNASIGDVFNIQFGVDNLGSNNIVFNPQQNGFLQRKIRNVTLSGTITVSIADDILIVNKTVPSATSISLPSNPNIGNNYTIKDGAGNASTYPITITPPLGTIDGGANYVINLDYGSVVVAYNGTQWNVI